jgi:light-regulated signal transduction histidine kinase (bacteriophytochrome)
VGSVLVVVEDVTDELATAARLIQTERLAAIGRMAAHVTHEVRNPLSSIGLNVELLEEELVHAGPEAAALLASVQQEVDRLTGITEQYLRLSRVPQPQLELGGPGQARAGHRRVHGRRDARPWVALGSGARGATAAGGAGRGAAAPGAPQPAAQRARGHAGGR